MTLLASSEPATRVQRPVPTEPTPLPSRMRAVQVTGYGSPDVLELAELPMPTPRAGELLIRVHTSIVTAADSLMRRGDPAYARLFLGVTKPKASVPGTGLSGVVVAVADDVTNFRVGDEVFGESGLGFGAHGEYVCVPSDGTLLHKPEELSFEDAATLTDGPLTSLNFLTRLAPVKPGDRVLIIGASGALGSAAVQLVKNFGAHVTGVCSEANLELVKALGADQVIDYAEEDFTREHDRYDIIFDTSGKSSYSRCKPSLTRSGVYMSAVLSMPLLAQTLWTRVFGSKRARFDATGLRPARELRVLLETIKDMMLAGTLRSVTERSYRLDQIKEANAHVDTGHKRGTVLLDVQGS